MIEPPSRRDDCIAAADTDDGEMTLVRRSAHRGWLWSSKKSLDDLPPDRSRLDYPQRLDDLGGDRFGAAIKY